MSLRLLNLFATSKLLLNSVNQIFLFAPSKYILSLFSFTTLFSCSNTGFITLHYNPSAKAYIVLVVDLFLLKVYLFNLLLKI